MSLRLIAPPSTLPVTVELARWNSRIDITEDDALIEHQIRAALARAEKYTGRAFEPQTWEVVLDAFPDGEILLPFGPVVSITSVKYDDADAVEQTISPADYVLDNASMDAWLISVEDADWPTTLTGTNTVRVRYLAGDGTPVDVQQAILLLVGDWYDTRTSSTEKVQQQVPFGASMILDLHRRLFV